MQKTGDKVLDNLYQAVVKYIEKNKGNVVVIGGVALVNEGEKYKYGLMVRITGKKPKF